MQSAVIGGSSAVLVRSSMQVELECSTTLCAIWAIMMHYSSGKVAFQYEPMSMTLKVTC